MTITTNGHEEEHNKKKLEEAKKLVSEKLPLNNATVRSFSGYYSASKLWRKVAKYAKVAGSKILYPVLILAFTLQKPGIPKKVKLTIAGALGYFIFPIDVIPDFIPVVGFVDDFAVIMWALFQVGLHIDETVKTQAREKLAVWFSEDVDTSEIDDQLNK